MKKTLSITAFIIAGSACAMADVYSMKDFLLESWHDTGTHTYSWATNVSDSNFNDNSGFFYKGSGWSVDNYSSNLSVDLSKNARYEIYFEFYSSGGGTTGQQPLGNFYLSGQSSIIFGNYYMNHSTDSGAARIAHTWGQAANGSLGDTSNILNATYILNDSWGNNGPNWNYQSPGSTVTAVGGGKISDGYHAYRLIIESSSDTNDKFALCYERGGTQTWFEGDLQKNLGIDANQNFSNLGFFIHDGGGYANPEAARVYSYDRTLKPVPEPSAFGLLAGLGALCLVGARRRRR